VIGADLRGAEILIGLVDLSLRVRHHWTYTIHSEKGEYIYKRLLRSISDVYTWCHERRFPVLGIGVATPGLIDPNTGKVIEADNLQWYDFSLQEQLSNEFDCIVVVDNDTNAAAYGEYLYGTGRDKRVDNMMYVSVDTGVGSGLILNGELYTGCDGMAGEIGHVVVNINGSRCSCGKRGCLESVASGPSLVREYRRLANKGSGMAEVSLHELISRAEKGEVIAGKVIRTAGQAVGIAVGNQVNVLNLECIVFGGSVLANGKLMLAAIRDGLRQSVLPKLWKRLDVRLGELGSMAGVIGISSLHISKIFGSVHSSNV
jgi:predicted NBD/HSP70 family sugar kinase